MRLPLRRLFHFDGKLGGLRYEARLGVFELNSRNDVSLVNEIREVPRKQLPGTAEGALEFALQLWESEGGAR